jgi:hypothetical protein
MCRSRTGVRTAAAAVAAALAVPITCHVPATAATPSITVNLGADTGPVHHGASGALYGLSEDGVPGLPLLAPLHLRTIAQKPPGGAQHPTGDADRVAGEFVAAGGSRILVYVQDYYSDWPYQNNGIADYESVVDTVAAALKASPYHSHYVYVPFNEPDGIWYSPLNPGSSSYAANLARFESDWTTIYHRIRADDPGAVIAGPNTASYYPRLFSDFLTYAKDNGVLPDVLTWHELAPSSIANFPGYVASGTAVATRNSAAAGGAYVGFIGKGPANTVTFNGITVPRTGTYRLGITYANFDSASSGNYNENLIDRGMEITTSAGTNETAYFRNTYSWSQFWTVDVDVQLNSGTNTVTFGNATAYAPDIDQITVAPLALR